MDDHSHTGTETDTPRPEWWVENERIKDSFGLPPYDPPRFSDDVYVHDVVAGVEAEYDCDVQFIGLDTRYLDDWTVRIDGEHAFAIGRFRDENGNTVYRLTADEFRERVDEWVSQREA